MKKTISIIAKFTITLMAVLAFYNNEILIGCILLAIRIALIIKDKN